MKPRDGRSVANRRKDDSRREEVEELQMKTRWTKKRLKALINAATAMLAGEEGEGDWDPSNSADDLSAGLTRLQEELAALERNGA